VRKAFARCSILTNFNLEIIRLTNVGLRKSCSTEVTQVMSLIVRLPLNILYCYFICIGDIRLAEFTSTLYLVVIFVVFGFLLVLYNDAGLEWMVRLEIEALHGVSHVGEEGGLLLDFMGHLPAHGLELRFVIISRDWCLLQIGEAVAIFKLDCKRASQRSTSFASFIVNLPLFIHFHSNKG